MQALTITGRSTKAEIGPQTNRSQITAGRLLSIVLAACPSISRDNGEARVFLGWVALASRGKTEGATFPLPTQGMTDPEIVAAWNAFLDDTDTEFSGNLVRAIEAEREALAAPATAPEPPAPN